MTGEEARKILRGKTLQELLETPYEELFIKLIRNNH